MVEATLINRAMLYVREALTGDLLRPEFADLPFPAGHCYVASEALWWLLGGPESGLQPVRVRNPETQVVHWWLEDEIGVVYDPTVDQFTPSEAIYLHARGVPGGFLTNKPSKRARIVIDRVREAVMEAQFETSLQELILH